MAPLSASSDLFRRSILPGTSRPARLATPISVPVASNSSTRKNTSTTLSRPLVTAVWMSSCRKVGAIDGGAEKMPRNWLPPKKNEATVTPTMPIRMAPGTRALSSATMARKPSTARITGAECRSPSVTSVALSPTTIPALLSAISARNRPMPTVMALRSDCGMPSMMCLRMPNSVTTRNKQPEMNTAPSAACQVKPMCSTTA